MEGGFMRILNGVANNFIYIKMDEHTLLTVAARNLIRFPVIYRSETGVEEREISQNNWVGMFKYIKLKGYKISDSQYAKLLMMGLPEGALGNIKRYREFLNN
jgi:hypothetical protein